jgi:hypothetical protein
MDGNLEILGFLFDVALCFFLVYVAMAFIVVVLQKRRRR